MRGFCFPNQGEFEQFAKKRMLKAIRYYEKPLYIKMQKQIFNER
jgi:hypothetical protein